MKILFLGDSLAIQTGLNYVISNIMLQALKGFPDSEMGYINIAGPDINGLNAGIHGEEFCTAFENFKIFNCQIKHPTNYKNFDSAIESFRPDIVFSVSDPWNLETVAFSKYRNLYKWICYVPIETPQYPEHIIFPTHLDGSLRKSIKNILEKSDLLIPVTSVGKNALNLLNLKSEYPIYHGLTVSDIFTGQYKKSDIFTHAISEDMFVFMTMGENSERKRLDLVVEAFNIFIHSIEDPDRYKLYIHSNLNKVEGPDVLNQLSQYNLIKYVLIPSCFQENKILRKVDLFKRYAVSDCFITLAAAEGFGYGHAEAMLQGTPSIYTNYGGTTTYLDKNCGIAVPYNNSYLAKNSAIKWVLADVNRAAEAMRTMALMPKGDRMKMGLYAQKKAIQLFDWNKLGESFNTHIKNALTQKSSGYDFSFIIEKTI